MKRDEKAQVVDEIAAQIERAGAVYAIDYRGLSVTQAAELRSNLREAGATFRVVKNTLTLRAADKAGAEHLKSLVEEGPTALTFVEGDAALVAKALDGFARQAQVLDFKGGLLGDEALTPDQIRQIARLPGRDRLNAQIAGIVASPLTGLVRGLGSMLSGLAVALGQVASQKEESPAEQVTEPPAEEPPAEEPPAEEPPAKESAADEPAGEEPVADEPGGEQETGQEPESQEQSEPPAEEDEESKEE